MTKARTHMAAAYQKLPRTLRITAETGVFAKESPQKRCDIAPTNTRLPKPDFWP